LRVLELIVTGYYDDDLARECRIESLYQIEPLRKGMRTSMRRMSGSCSTAISKGHLAVLGLRDDLEALAAAGQESLLNPVESLARRRLSILST